VSRERDVRSRMSDDDVIVDAMADAARQIAFEDAGPGPTPAVWHRLQTRRARGSRPPWRGLLVVSAGAAAVLALVMVGRDVQRGRPLTYVVAADAVEQDGYIRGGQGKDGSRVQFSDGTHVDLGHGARVSVLSRGPRGARLRARGRSYVRNAVPNVEGALAAVNTTIGPENPIEVLELAHWQDGSFVWARVKPAP